MSLDIGKGTSRTKNGYKNDMIAIIEIIGRKSMADITEDDIRKVFNQLSDTYAQVVLDKKWGTCKRIFRYAYKKKYINIDVFEDLEKPKSQKVDVEDEEYSEFTDVELVRITTAAKKHKTIYPILMVLKSTGMRPGELRALRWKNFDKDSKTIRILSAVTKHYEKVDDVKKKAKFTEVVSVTKSKFSIRTLDLSDEAVAALVEWRKHLDSHKNHKMKYSPYIFPNQQGSFMKEAALKSLLDKFVAKYDLKDTGIHLYKFRHTMCSRLIVSNIPVSIIQRIMGDITQDVIMKIYTHIYRDDVRAASAKFFEKENEKFNEGKGEQVS